MIFSVKYQEHSLVPVQVTVLLSLSLLSNCTEADYALHFPNKGTTDYAVFNDVPSFNEFTLCFWMNSTGQNPGTLFSYCHSSADYGNELVIYHYGAFALNVQNDERWASIKYYIEQI